MNTTTERCQKCNGHGDIPSGYDRFGSGLMAWRTCPACNGRGTVEVETEPEPTPPAPAAALTITDRFRIAGHDVTAPGFNPDSFDRAIHRAFAAGLTITGTAPGAVTVENPTNGHRHTVTRRTCSCKATRPCMHRAYALMVADIWHALPVPAPATAAA